MKAIRNRSNQHKIYDRIIRSQKKFFHIFEEYEGGYFTLSHYVLDVSLEPFYLNVWNGSDALGLYLRGPSIDRMEDDRFILAFSTSTPRGGITAGLLVKEESKVYLMHDGRVFSGDGRGNPYFDEPKIEIDGRSYFRVGDVDSQTLFPRIVEFHQSRLNRQLKTQTGSENHVGFDPGLKRGGLRSSVVFSARHNPITTALREELLRRHYSVVSCVASPDLLVENIDHRLLFEVKPFAKLHDMIVACGQLMIYQEAANADLKVIVTEKCNIEKTEYLHRFIIKEKIAIVVYKTNGNKFLFENIDEVISGMKKI